MDVNPNDFKFIQGLLVARDLLVQLKRNKQSQMGRKNHSTNSLSFSPIARRQSHIVEPSSEQSIKRHRKSPSQGPREVVDPETPRQETIKIDPTVDDFKEKINNITIFLRQAYADMKVSEVAMDVLRERLDNLKPIHKQIENLKEEERNKHFKLLTLKNSLLKKRQKLEKQRKVKEQFRKAVADIVRQYMRQREESLSEEIIEVFAKDFKVTDGLTPNIADDKLPAYPTELNLKYGKTKKKEKKKIDTQPVSAGLAQVPQMAPLNPSTFLKPNYAAEMQNYCDDMI